MPCPPARNSHRRLGGANRPANARRNQIGAAHLVRELRINLPRAAIRERLRLHPDAPLKVRHCNHSFGRICAHDLVQRPVAAPGKFRLKAMLFKLSSSHFRHALARRPFQDCISRNRIESANGNAADAFGGVLAKYANQSATLCFGIDARETVPRALLRFAESRQILSERHIRVSRLKRLGP